MKKRYESSCFTPWRSSLRKVGKNASPPGKNKILYDGLIGKGGLEREGCYLILKSAEQGGTEHCKTPKYSCTPRALEKGAGRPEPCCNSRKKDRGGEN